MRIRVQIDIEEDRQSATPAVPKPTGRLGVRAWLAPVAALLSGIAKLIAAIRQLC